MSKEFVSDFGMFSETGDLAVGEVIDNARTYGWNWARTLTEIYALARSASDKSTRRETLEALREKLIET